MAERTQYRTFEWLQNFERNLAIHLRAGRTASASALFRRIPPDMNDCVVASEPDFTLLLDILQADDLASAIRNARALRLAVDQMDAALTQLQEAMESELSSC